MCKKLTILFLLITAICNISTAQIDAHFTQYYANPLWLNPALTGVFDGDYRVNSIFRNQKVTTASPILTKGVIADMQLPQHFSLGIMINNQTSANGGFYYNNAYLSVGYQIQLSDYQVLSSGFELGVINRGFDPSKLSFGNQYSPITGYDPTLPSNEIFSKTSSYALDMSTGLMYFNGDPYKRLNPFFGMSIYHFNNPSNSFLTGSSADHVPFRYVVNGGARINISPILDITPHLVYIQQGTAREIAAGVYSSIMVDEEKDFIVGTSYRLQDAVTANVGLRIKEFFIGLSYDVNISPLRNTNSYQGAYEISFSYTHKNTKKADEPKFVCPRL